MEIRLLRSFLAVAREQNISRAAQMLHITQPSLSRQIMDLEESLGLTLFLRGKRAMTLTDQGMLLRKRAEQILDLVYKTVEELATTEAVNGTVYIGVGETHAFRSLTDGINIPLQAASVFCVMFPSRCRLSFRSWPMCLTASAFFSSAMMHDAFSSTDL